MIRAVHIAGFRGIRESVAAGLGRVNLVIGRNDCGKTAFLEAVQIAENALNAAHIVRYVQERRLSAPFKAHDFERFWRPIFLDFDARTGFSISVTRDDGSLQTLKMWQSARNEQLVLEVDDNSEGRADGMTRETATPLAPTTWKLDIDITTYHHKQTRQEIVGKSAQVTLPPIADRVGSAWISSSAGISESDIRCVSMLKQRGRDGVLVELLREVDNRLSGIELLSPGGDVAELFVRLDNGTPMLPMTLMGEGLQRCLEIGACAAVHDWPTLFIDEVENGMHHLVLEPLWRWIATMSRRRDLQVFATTHSEECIHAACRAFGDLDDDGLRVIRLDRLERETRATIYDRALIEVAERTGTEIRG
jgi:hypothetical protein